MFIRLLIFPWFLIMLPCANAAQSEAQVADFPQPVSQYDDAAKPLWERITARAQAVPFNLIVTILFLAAILHTFLAPTITAWSHRVERRHHAAHGKDSFSPWAATLEFLGEIEVVFSLWVVPVLLVAFWHYGWDNLVAFLNVDSKFTEPMFVFVIMAIAASRPVVKFAERILEMVVVLGKGSPCAWWLALLVLAPLLGSLITEPAAMTIAAMILARKIYELQPSRRFKYATLGLLFVNVSIGGTLTNFAAPPVLMVAGPDRWNWSSIYMLSTFGWRAVAAIALSTALYLVIFRKELASLATKAESEKEARPPIGWVDDQVPVPVWITVMHLAFLGWTVLTAHYPTMFIGGFLFFMGITHTTKPHQSRINLRAPLMVAFFLAGLVIHGRLQSWWLEPVLSSGLGDWPMHLGAAVLTAFNDNALITFLASQVGSLGDSAKYAIMSGAVAAGGLTVIANAPNPAGQALLKRYFPNGVSPLGLFLGAFLPTVISVLVFMVIR